MITLVATILFFILAFGIMALALHFSKYKQRPTCESCHCSGGDCENQQASV